MGKTALFAAIAAAVVLAGIGGWAASNAQARSATSIDVLIDPFKMMTGTTPLPTEHFDDFSLVFN